MPNKVYVVDLTEEERAVLLELIGQGSPPARKVRRAHILLLADKGKTDVAIADALHTSVPTVHRTRQRFVEGNLDRALNEDPRPGASKKLDEKEVAVLEMLARSQPPAGQKHWTLQLLADRLVELTAVDTVSYETVRQELKKSGLSLGSRRNG